MARLPMSLLENSCVAGAAARSRGGSSTARVAHQQQEASSCVSGFRAGKGKGSCGIRQRLWSGSAAGSNVCVGYKRVRHVSTRECSG